MKTNETVSVLREDLDRMASAFGALAVVIEHCDVICAVHVARIFEHYACDMLDEIDRSLDQREGGAA